MVRLEMSKELGRTIRKDDPSELAIANFDVLAQAIKEGKTRTNTTNRQTRQKTRKTKPTGKNKKKRISNQVLERLGMFLKQNLGLVHTHICAHQRIRTFSTNNNLKTYTYLSFQRFEGNWSQLQFRRVV